MTKRKLSDFEKVRARADYVAQRNKQFAPVDIQNVRVEDWTDENGKPVIVVQA